jgi:tRNA-dependent cyclodipeptide synthase
MIIKNSNRHALIAVSPFNSYFSVKNMTMLFNWAYKNFDTFNIFMMDEVSVFNLMAIGYSEQQALQKTKKQDHNLKNKVIKSLTSIGFSVVDAHEKIVLLSQLSKSNHYSELYKKYTHIFKTNTLFRQDCLDATKAMLSEKMELVSDKAISLAVHYLLAELPIWFDIPYLLNIESSVLVYKELSFFWKKICYNYNLLSPQQTILIKAA